MITTGLIISYGHRMLIAHIILIFTTLTVPIDEVRNLERTAPSYLTMDLAHHHLAAAMAVAVATGLDHHPVVVRGKHPSRRWEARHLLLSMGHHESRYQHREVTPEAGGKFSCGVMTPEPMHDRERCRLATSSVTAGYMHGALHLIRWLDTMKDVRLALMGYAGGFVLIRHCREHTTDRRCAIPWAFLNRAEQIAGRR